MPKPDDIVIEYKLGGWDIQHDTYGFDVGEIGPEYVNFRATVYWVTDQRVGKHDNIKSEQTFDTFSEAIKFIEEETGLKYA